MKPLFPLYDANNNWVLNFEDQIVTDFVTVGRPELMVTGVVVPVPATLVLYSSGLLVLGSAMRKNAG